MSVAEGALLDREALQHLTLRVLAQDGAPEARRRHTSVPVRILFVCRESKSEYIKIQL